MVPLFTSPKTVFDVDLQVCMWSISCDCPFTKLDFFLDFFYHLWFSIYNLFFLVYVQILSFPWMDTLHGPKYPVHALIFFFLPFLKYLTCSYHVCICTTYNSFTVFLPN